MQVITSTDNKIVKFAAALSEKKYRDKEGCYLIEGPNFVRDSIRYGGRLRFIFIKAERASAEILQIADEAEKAGLAVYQVSDSVFSKLAQTTTPQGIIAVAEKKNYSSEEFFRACGNKNVLVLDSVQDPGNIGTLLRAAEAADFGGAVFIKGCGDVYSPKAVRATAGTIRRFPLLFAAGPGECADVLKEHGKKVFAAAMEGSISIYDAKMSQDSAVVIGNEGNGVSAEMLKCADQIISIPMAGQIESLNAGLAGGIIMYEARRQAIAALK